MLILLHAVFDFLEIAQDILLGLVEFTDAVVVAFELLEHLEHHLLEGVPLSHVAQVDLNLLLLCLLLIPLQPQQIMGSGRQLTGREHVPRYAIGILIVLEIVPAC